MDVLGLATSYMQQSGYHRLLWKLMVMPLLPANHLVPTFRALDDRARGKSDAIDALLTYVDTTWLQNSVWTKDSLSVFGQQIRTNNDVEGWHRRLNQLARRKNVPFSSLLKLLHGEATYIGLQVRLLSAGKLQQHARKKYRSLNGRLQKLWDELSAGDRSTSSFLRAASHLQLPNWQ